MKSFLWTPSSPSLAPYYPFPPPPPHPTSPQQIPLVVSVLHYFTALPFSILLSQLSHSRMQEIQTSFRYAPCPRTPDRHIPLHTRSPARPSQAGGPGGTGKAPLGVSAAAAAAPLRPAPMSMGAPARDQEGGAARRLGEMGRSGPGGMGRRGTLACRAA